MSVALATSIWMGIGAYLAVGSAVAVLLLLGLIGRVDPLAGQAPIRVRLLLFPGLTALWPLILVKALLGRPKEPA